MNNYRRGTILGLTVAETFLLLTFLLLFVLIYLTRMNVETPDNLDILKQTLKRTELALNEARANITETRKSEETMIQENNVIKQELIQARENAAEARKAEELTKKELERTRHELNEALANNEKSRNSENLMKQANDELRRELAEVRANARKAEELTKKELERTRHELNEALANNEKSHNSENLMKRANDELRRELAEVRQLASKGKNPPCWFREVKDRASGKTREQPYYVFHIAIHEKRIELAPRTENKPPQKYENEWKQLRISELPYGKMLTTEQFKSEVKYLYDKGKAGKVRDYACVFSVKVWDKTPEDAKKRWKEVHDGVIENWFTAYTVKKDKWNGLVN